MRPVEAMGVPRSPKLPSWDQHSQILLAQLRSETFVG